MGKKKKKKYSIKQKMYCYMLLLLLFSSLLPLSSADETNSSNTLGWKLLDSGAVLCIWNNFDSYYFNVSNGMQFTNHYRSYWTCNVMMLGYYVGGNWHLLYRVDELTGFNKTIDLSEDYCNATLWKDLSYMGYNFRIAIRYSLGVDDHNLTVIPYIKNLGVDIPYQLAFGWELKDIQINMVYDNNLIEVNDTEYDLTGEINNSYTNLTKQVCDYDWINNTWNNYTAPNPLYVLKNNGYYLYLKWNENLDYLLTVKTRFSQYNAPVTLFIKVGTLDSGQEKYTSLFWYDSPLTIRPVGNGSYTQLLVYSGSTNHWENVDDVVSDDGATANFDGSYGGWKTDTYNATNHTIEYNFITKIVLYTKCGYSNLGYSNQIKFDLFTNGTLWQSSSQAITTPQYKQYTATVEYNPNTDKNWTWEDIDDLEIGLTCYSASSVQWVSFTILYAEVYYEPHLWVMTNESEGVEGENATLVGWIKDDNISNVSSFFQYGPDTDYDLTGTNTSKQYPMTENNSFSANVSSLSQNTTYYFRAVINDTIGTYAYGVNLSFTTKIVPEPPFDCVGVIYGNYFNISWNNTGYGIDTTMVRKKTGSYPTSITDGILCQNNSLNYFNKTKSDLVYYSLWSYNSTLVVFSNQVNFTYGGLLVDVFDSNTSLNITNWDILISNSDGSEVYTETNCNNTVNIDITNCPQGLISITISHTNYSTMIYYMTIYNGNWYTLNVYLSLKNDSLIFLIQVIDDYNQPITNALLTIKKYINTTDVYETITNLYTDGYGEIETYLVPGKLYKVFITKTLYEDIIENYIPDVDIRTKIFKMSYSFTVNDTYEFWNLIVFNGTMYTNGTIKVNYVDSKTNTTNASFYTYERYNSTLTLKATNITNSDSFSFWINGINDSRTHIIVVYLNHTNLGFVTKSIILSPVNTSITFITDDIETKTTNVFGSFTPGYVNFFLLYLPFIIIIVLSAPFNVGAGIIGGALWLGGAARFITVPVEVVILIPLIIALGVLLMIVKGGKIHL